MRIKTFFLAIGASLITFACALPSFGGDGTSGPTAEPPVPPSGSILFQDDFSDASSGWDRVTGDHGVEDYDNGVYRIQVVSPDFNSFGTPGKNFRDVRIEVDTAKIGGPDSNRAGLICRFQSANETAMFYFFFITSDGFYAMGLTNGNQSMLLGQNELAQNSNIKTGLAINHLRADCAGNMLSFYVNGFLVGQATDDTLTRGDVGLLAGTFTEGAVDIIFDQFIVLQP
ncbi:MAG: hypothetical protein AB1750_01135 [Chloroflexota bacterium]